MNSPKVWYFYFPSVNGEGYAHVFLTSNGCLSTISDWGEYGYKWPDQGWGSGDFRAWLVGRGDDYLISKLKPGKEFYSLGTENAMEVLVCDLPGGDEMISDIHFTTEDDVWQWASDWDIEDQFPSFHEEIQYVPNWHIKQWCERVFTQLKSKLIEDLAAEAIEVKNDVQPLFSQPKVTHL